ncbi:GDSL-type esterase/lipase family protein [Tautonia plasticadhaerens]|uniref:SGNH hydrolase-type esterase domain-containing protein n=1 Tax=Tautonia plasticadhaerens TaxID=2527974 RepID=A0A518GWH5_9BACT|nr:GDSL-type esterase/lipase family protein [Tautonia plasticadhaerens]QDV32946.1 hypothetical protein ElP_07880 [Tautonia plasticadhaerens]
MIRPPRHPVARLSAIVASVVLLMTAVASAVLSRVAGPDPDRRGPTIAAPRAHLDEWVGRHARHVSRAMAGPAPLLLLGDSITRGWLGPALDGEDSALDRLRRRRLDSRGAVNFGMDGDHVEHLLWRLRHGGLAGLRPELVVLLAGTNNIGLDAPEAIAEGVVALVDEIRRRSPDSVILVIGMLPRGTTLGHGQPAISDVPDPRIAEINRLLAPIDARPRVAFLDFGHRLLDEDGRVVRSMQPDLLHLSTEGYGAWADAMEPTLRLFFGPPPGADAGDPRLLSGSPAG